MALMPQTDIFALKTGEPVRMQVKLYRCLTCGTEAQDMQATLIPTAEYNLIEGMQRRRFRFQEQNPVCACTGDVWLSNNGMAELGEAS